MTSQVERDREKYEASIRIVAGLETTSASLRLVAQSLRQLAAWVRKDNPDNVSDLDNIVGTLSLVQAAVARQEEAWEGYNAAREQLTLFNLKKS